MKLLILCVDGFDPDYARENGYDRLPYSKKLTIPRECYVDTPEGPIPHTDRVWPSMFSGITIDHGLKVRGPLRQLGHDALVKLRMTWQGPPVYGLSPTHEGLDTVFKEYDSFLWNIPTISPEWIMQFPTFENFVEYCEREFLLFSILARGLPAYPHEVGAVYTRIMDAYGHHETERKLDSLYGDIVRMAEEISRTDDLDLMLLSDHGCINRTHTDHAYAGATFPFEAESVLDIRRVIGKKMGPETVSARASGRLQELTEEEEREIKKRLKRLGYIG